MNPRAAALMLSVLIAPLQALAADGELTPVPASNQQCVALVPGSTPTPVYPEKLLIARQGGTVKLEMEFASSDSAPQVRVNTSSGQTEFDDSAIAFARQYRNGCFKAGTTPLRAVQEFAFVPNDGRKVTWTTAGAMGQAGEPDPKFDRSCITNTADKPKFPRGAREYGVGGRVLMRLEFTALDTEPKVAIIVPGRRPDLDEAVLEFGKTYRAKCGKIPLSAVQLFSFTFDDREKKQPLSNIGLVTFLGATRNAKAKPVFFDLNTMACPFDVSVQYWQPTYQNRVGELGPTVAARRPFLDWLSTLELDINERSANAILGDSLTVAVPCGKIDL